MKTLLILLLRGYKFFISPLLGNNCRFYPSCSEYMATAIGRFGVFRGLRLGLKRLGRCHPGCPGGIDHVPEHWQGTQPGACQAGQHTLATQDQKSAESNTAGQTTDGPGTHSRQPDHKAP